MELTGNVNGMINLGGGGGGSTVEVTPIVTSGEHIANIEVDGVTSELYAPAPPDPTTVEVTPIVTSGDHIADIEVNGVTSELYASSKTEVNYSTTPQRTGRKWIDGKDELEVTISVTLSSNNINHIDVSSLNIGTIIAAEFALIHTNGSAIFPSYYEDNTWRAIVTYDAPNNRIGVVSSTTVINTGYNTLNIILRYTVNNS